MKKFLLFLTIFCVPIVIFIISLEFLVHKIPNSYSFKYNYVLNSGDSIRAISMGHSQLYDGFKPESFKLNAFNLCNSAQSFKEDYYLLRDMLQYMPNVKCVIVPIGYMNVKEQHEEKESFTERSTFYREYMNVDYDNRIPLKYRYECFDPQRAYGKVVSYYLHHQDIIGCDSLGRRSTHGIREKGKKLGQEKVLYDYTVVTHDKNNMRIEVGDYLERIAGLLESKHIKLVLVSPPHYWAIFNQVNIEQKEFLQDYIKSLSGRHKFQYINLEDDSRFEDADYYNETHLSDIGAEKFTKILNDSIIL